MTPSFSPAKAVALVRAIEWISSAQAALFARLHPKATRWTVIWAELRQSYGPTIERDLRHRTALVLCSRNLRTKKTTEKLLFVGSGDCPVCTAADLYVQLRAEIPEALRDPAESYADAATSAVALSPGSRTFPIGMFGGYVVGRS